MNNDFVNLAWEQFATRAPDTGGGAEVASGFQHQYERGINRMDAASLAGYAKQPGGITEALADTSALEVMESGDGPVAFLLKPDIFYLLLAAAKDTQPNFPVSEDAEKQNYITSADLLVLLGE